VSEPFEIMTAMQPEEMPQPAAEYRLPNLLHTVVFFVIATLITLLVTVAVLGITLGVSRLPGFQHSTLLQLAKDPMVLMVAQALSYVVTLLVVALIFSEWWQKSFSEGIEWNWSAVRGRGLLYAGGGLFLGLTAYLVSMLLTVPKSLPVDDYFQSAAVVWVIALFGTTLGPLCEEIAFRGFLLPSLVAAWKWTAKKLGKATNSSPSSTTNYAAMIFSTVLTSIAFTAMHAPQLANTLSVLCLLFLVSVVLTVVRIRARSVAASTLVHAGYNLWNFLMMFIITGGFRHLDKLQR
jgi:membrane protease YdiL (CAAX protease family)